MDSVVTFPLTMNSAIEFFENKGVELVLRQKLLSERQKYNILSEVRKKISVQINKFIMVYFVFTTLEKEDNI